MRRCRRRRCARSLRAQRPALRQRRQRLRVHVNLRRLVGTGLTELWHADGKVETGRDGLVHFASGGRYLAGKVEIDERAAGGLGRGPRGVRGDQSLHAAQRSPRICCACTTISPTSMPGTAMRNATSCSAAAGQRDFRGWQIRHGRRPPPSAARITAAYCRCTGWPARNPVGALENPRQVSAFHYPRQYGPSPPSFSRAMQVAGGLLISGTASVLGHASHHPDDLAGQLDEILRNLASLRQASGSTAAQAGRGTLLKVYLRNTATAGFVANYLRARLPAQVQFLVLGADICRRELLAEIDAAHLLPGRLRASC